MIYAPLYFINIFISEYLKRSFIPNIVKHKYFLKGMSITTRYVNWSIRAKFGLGRRRYNEVCPVLRPKSAQTNIPVTLTFS